MKTTVEISDNLFAEARRIALREKRSLRALIEEGLRRVVGERRKQARPFKLRQASYGGTGLDPELASADWEAVRRQIYQGRGE